MAGYSPWLVRLPCVELGLGGSSFRFCLVVRCWPTPIHVPGEKVRHDCSEYALLQGGRPSLKGHRRVACVAMSCPTGCVQCPHLYLVFEGSSRASAHSAAARKEFPSPTSISRMALLGSSPVDRVIAMMRLTLVHAGSRSSISPLRRRQWRGCGRAPRMHRSWARLSIKALRGYGKGVRPLSVNAPLSISHPAVLLPVCGLRNQVEAL